MVEMTVPVPVLVVDDHAAFRAVVRSLLVRSDEFDLVGEAASGEEAIEMAGALHPELVVMDIMMGGIGGIAATSAITSQHPEMTVVLVSTYGRDDLPAEAGTCGAAAYIGKSELSAGALRKVLASRSAADAPD